VNAKTVLVIDDSMGETIAFYLSEYIDDLEEESKFSEIKFLSANTLLDAYNLLESGIVDLIIVDVTLEGDYFTAEFESHTGEEINSGIDFVRWLRSNKNNQNPRLSKMSKLPVLFISARDCFSDNITPLIMLDAHFSVKSILLEEMLPNIWETSL
jgi:hypothetical protein